MLVFLQRQLIKKLKEKIKLLEDLRCLYEEIIKIEDEMIKEYQILLNEKVASERDSGDSIQGTSKGTKK